MKATSKEYERLLFTLDAVTDLSRHVVEAREFVAAARSMLYLLLGSVGIPRGVLYRCDPSGRLRVAAAKPASRENGRGASAASVAVTRAEAAEMAAAPELMPVSDKRLPSALRSALAHAGMTMALPLVVRGRLAGVLAVGTRLNEAALSHHERGALETLGRYAAVLLHQHDMVQQLRAAVDENVRLCETLANTYFDTVQAFSTAIDAKDMYTRGHSLRVARYAAMLATRAGMPSRSVVGVRIGAYLHDIGKIVLDRSLLNKPSRLDEAEIREVASHPVVGDDVLSRVSFPWPEVRLVVRSHHERMDGRGYPDGLSDQQIPVSARVLSIADAFDAMTSNRPYRNSLPLESALTELVRCSGEQFDPLLVRVFLEQCRSEVKDGGAAPKAAGPAKSERKKGGRLRVFGSLLEQAENAISSSFLDSLMEKLGAPALQPA